MTANTIRALHVVGDQPKGLTAAEFALKYWPDNEGWTISGGGQGMLTAAIFYLSRLVKMGLVVKAARQNLTRDKCFSWVFRLSAIGEEALAREVQKAAKNVDHLLRIVGRPSIFKVRPVHHKKAW